MERRVLIADDHPLFRDAMNATIGRLWPDKPIEEAETLSAVRESLAQDSDVELVLLDLKLPDADGFAGLIFLRADFPQVPIVIVSGTEDSETVTRSVELGAQGFIPKSASRDDLADALETIVAGDIWTPSNPGASSALTGGALVSTLSPGQLKVLTGLRRGLGNKEMAREMGVSHATIKAHLAGAFRRLGVNNRTQALARAFSLGPPPSK